MKTYVVADYSLSNLRCITCLVQEIVAESSEYIVHPNDTDSGDVRFGDDFLALRAASQIFSPYEMMFAQCFEESQFYESYSEFVPALDRLQSYFSRITIGD